MRKGSLFFILIFHTKAVFSRVLGEEKDETTPTPMSIHDLGPEAYCKFQPNSFDCGEKERFAYRYYYDVKMKTCRVIITGDCNYNRNTFISFKDCNEFCLSSGDRRLVEKLTPNVFCRMQPQFGSCDGYYPMWYYDVSKRTCVGFSYSGCDGNQNKFKTARDCTFTCVPSVEYITVVL